MTVKTEGESFDGNLTPIAPDQGVLDRLAEGARSREVERRKKHNDETLQTTREQLHYAVRALRLNFNSDYSISDAHREIIRGAESARASCLLCGDGRLYDDPEDVDNEGRHAIDFDLIRAGVDGLDVLLNELKLGEFDYSNYQHRVVGVAYNRESYYLVIEVKHVWPEMTEE